MYRKVTKEEFWNALDPIEHRLFQANHIVRGGYVQSFIEGTKEVARIEHTAGENDRYLLVKQEGAL